MSTKLLTVAETEAMLADRRARAPVVVSLADLSPVDEYDAALLASSSWAYKRSNLTIATRDGGYVYEIDLERIKSSAQALDWILQIAGKTWATPRTVRDLVRTLECIFGRSQLGPRGQNVRANVLKAIDGRAALQRDYEPPAAGSVLYCNLCGAETDMLLPWLTADLHTLHACLECREGTDHEQSRRLRQLRRPETVDLPRKGQGNEQRE